MPHQCVRCSKIYEDGAKEILQGCECGARFFFFIKKKSELKAAKELTVDLTPKDKKQIEDDIRDIIGDEIEDDAPVILELENIKVLQPGKYELDLVDLFNKKPLVYKLEDGKYVIDIANSFHHKKDKKSKS